ncbi:DUF1513 domain-containing protein [Marinospirillum sp.]|uniref:DUF1513 domain-containing protein n=1 Tax=Marinospirillum sp. TaxID=2183934 RepID=UPI00286FEF67|nr:DUF1513 domain-containing protein [Marinospirillum sp.]MDR9469235.1 DUF1513 domain-containing protein [Marinospirillum sp.]
MAIKRRQFLTWLAATPALATSSSLLLAATGRTGLRFASSARGNDGHFYLKIASLEGKQLASHRLPDRAHQVLAHPGKPWVLTLARRPGTFIDIYDAEALKPRAQIQVENGYRLYGHAQISADGRYLFTSERHPVEPEGRLVVRDLEDNYRVVREMTTHGIGPHEFHWMPDGKTLVIANGGIQTNGREKLNLNSMQPSLVYLDSESGELLEKRTLPDEFHQCSIRHLDVAADGQVVIALQYQGHPVDRVPLIAAHRRGEELAELILPERIRSQLRQYCGSACFDSSGRFAAVSAPRGNLTTLWDMQERRFLNTAYIADGCGLAPTLKTGEFLVSSGQGQVFSIQALSEERQPLFTQSPPPVNWDNHMTLI